MNDSNVSIDNSSENDKPPQETIDSTVSITWPDLMKIAKNATILLTLLGLFFATYMFIERRYALHKELIKVKQQVMIVDLRLQSANKNLEIEKTQERLWSKKAELKKEKDDNKQQKIDYEIQKLNDNLNKYKEEYTRLTDRISNLVKELDKSQ